jgi:hypothetical protein
MRVLHVLEPIRLAPTPWFIPGESPSGLAEASLLAAGECFAAFPESHEAIILGGARDARWAGRLGVRRPGTLCPALGLGALSRERLHRYAATCGPFRHLVCWSPGAARAVGRRLRRTCPVSTIDLRTGTVSTSRPDGSMDVQKIPTKASAIERTDHVRAGWAARLRVRRGLTTDTTVIGVLGNNDEAGVILGHVLGILQVAGIPCRGLAFGQTGGMRRARRLAREGYPFIHAADVPASLLLAACDLTILVTDESGPDAPWARVLRRAAATGGVPVVRRRGADEPPSEAEDVCASESPADLARASRRVLEASARHGGPVACAAVDTPDVLAALRASEVPG